ncbi:uncharacterized protein LOC115676645 [Syzygium oleosum]|uniref:uncharacterized protein LOC115676645 n=1 Tax=Syzygium oleosum TaxID=219896 RepID=UPI0024B9AC2F|nr:uncharacterized protein LOC115676645 [Syzygium oleosum]
MRSQLKIPGKGMFSIDPLSMPGLGDSEMSGSAHLGGAAVAAITWARLRKGALLNLPLLMLILARISDFVFPVLLLHFHEVGVKVIAAKVLLKTYIAAGGTALQIVKRWKEMT